MWLRRAFLPSSNRVRVRNGERIDTCQFLLSIASRLVHCVLCHLMFWKWSLVLSSSFISGGKRVLSVDLAAIVVVVTLCVIIVCFEIFWLSVALAHIHEEEEDTE